MREWLSGDVLPRVRVAARRFVDDRLRRPWLAGISARSLVRGRFATARRAAALAAGGRGAAAVRAYGDEEIGLVRDGLDAAAVDRARPLVVLGARAAPLARALQADFRDVRTGASGRGGGEDAVSILEGAGEGAVPVLAGWLEAVVPSRAAERLAQLGDRSPIVALVPVWPEARHGAIDDGPARTLRTLRWWDATARRAGLEPALELRRESRGYRCLVLRTGPTDAAPAPPPARAPAPTPNRPRVRVNDDLSVAGSFAWISSSLAVALDEIGVPVSVAPTKVTPTLEPATRRRLDELMARDGDAGPVAGELGWTHFWRRYRRTLGGAKPLPLFAINYRFARSDPGGFDPWMRGLIAGSAPIAPISTFCRDVLAEAGVAPERLHVVPMGFTSGAESPGSGVLPGGRDLKVLHVTNSLDAERNGTDLAIEAFAAAFAPGDAATLVVRDYGTGSAALLRSLATLRDRGYDARYWPVFFPQEALGRFLSAFDVLLAPFRGEGFGIKLLDAMAAGLAVIAPPFGGPRDFMVPDATLHVPYDLVAVSSGYDSRSLELGNRPEWAQCRPAGLVSALELAAADPDGVRRRGELARRHALAEFSWRRSAERVAAILAEELG
jgi:glycosyltransferase involved in cell wall biosynthesis